MPSIETDGWVRVAPETVGLSADALARAVDYAKTNDTPAAEVAYDFSNLDPWDEAEGEYGNRIGPMPARRGGPNGVVLREGQVVAEWGDTERVDHCFSVAKSFLSLVAGLAWDRGDIASVDDPVAEYVDDGGFDSPHNRGITWRHLLQQTSEWEGTLFGKPDSVDRNRPVGRSGGPGKEASRDLRDPGAYWEYNDVRINRLSLSLLRVLGRPLSRVLAEGIMEPIGASGRWEWHGYHNSRVTVEGRELPCVSGGGHWGGGLWMSTRDLARVGQLVLDGGVWDGDRLLSRAWLDQSTAPCERNPGYGYLWWLNTDGGYWPSAPESAFAAIGHGGNTLWVDPEHDLVVVLRWLRSPDGVPGYRAVEDGFHERLLDAL